MTTMESLTSSVASTSTTSSTPAPTSTDNVANANQTNSFFTPSGSPPLILAFLAIGLFTAAMIAVFGYRRIHWGRPWAAGEVNVTTRRDDIGEKPKLWDVRATRRVTDVEGGWADILPFSASTISDADFSRMNHIRKMERMNGYIVHHLPRSFKRFLRTTESNDTTDRPETRLRVAIPIAMPSPRCDGTVAGPSQVADGVSSMEERVEYSIGLLEVPWHNMEEG